MKKKSYQFIAYPLLKQLQCLKAWQFLYKINRNDVAYDKITTKIIEFKSKNNIK